jgi:UDP-N-acetylmuramoyl-tripeptide--D-alanyl-D-alanine ligase
MAARLSTTDVIEALSGDRIDARPRLISDAVIDSREVTPDAMFIALPGENVDGHDFVEQAFQKGALVALVDRDVDSEREQIDLRDGLRLSESTKPEWPARIFVEDTLEALQKIAAHWRRQLDVRVIGITGSVGKSTSKELIADVLSRRFRTVRSPGNLNNEIGLPLSLLRCTRAHSHAVLEMGFYVPGEIELLCDIALPQVGVVTNVSQVHMERAGSMEAIVAGKTELVQSLPPDPEGVAILNYDEYLVRAMANQTAGRIFYYGLSPAADLWADEIEGLGLEGIRFVLHYGGESVFVRVPLLGRHSVHTALRAASVGLVEGLSWQEIVEGLQGTQSQLRLVAVQGPNGSLILDDTYNAAPPSVIAALNLLEDLDGRKVAVLGDMLELGAYEEEGHRLVGARAAEVADLLITVGERARWIAEEAVLAGMDAAKVETVGEASEALALLQTELQEQDVVLVKASRGIQLDLIVSELEAAL